MLSRLAPAVLLASTLVPACAVEEDLYEGEIVKDSEGKADSSAAALFVDFEFDGELVTDSAWNKEQAVEDQLLYTVGQLNGANSVGRVDRLVLTNVQASSVSGKTKITYHAKLPVAWGDKVNVPATFELKLPKDISYSAQSSFATKYGHACVDFGAHDVDAGSMFYYFRPRASGCTFEAADIVTLTASVSPSPINTTGKFPEYNKVWEDNLLQVVAVFGKYEDGATTASDAGIAGYNEFVKAMKTELGTAAVTVPASVPSSPGVSTPDIEWNLTQPDGKKVRVVALLVDNVREGGPVFEARYNDLSTKADYITYNGHAGLGANVRFLANKGAWVKGQYVVVFMNGCDTFTYVDDALNNAHKAVNPDDTTGAKYIDIVLNAMPSYFSNMPTATLAIFRALRNGMTTPKTYEQVFAGISSSQVVLVTGEQDNVFTPGGGGTPTTWSGLTGSGTVAKNATKTYKTPTLAKGTYSFEMTGTSDADLYVRIGSAPTTSTYDCRPYKSGSNETCEITLAQPAPIHVMVRGYATSSTFELVGKTVR